MGSGFGRKIQALEISKLGGYPCRKESFLQIYCGSIAGSGAVAIREDHDIGNAARRNKIPKLVSAHAAPNRQTAA